jgi:hypothetical protein
MKNRENTANKIRRRNMKVELCDESSQSSIADLPVRWCKRIFDVSFDDRCFSSRGAANKQDFANLYFCSQHSLVKIMNVSIKESCKDKLLKQNEGTKPVLLCWSKCVTPKISRL